MNLLKKIKKIDTRELSKLKKETLLKIINLNDYINEIFIVESIVDKIQLIEDDNKKKICEIRIMSILEDIDNVKYIDKETFGWYIIYTYKDKKTIYFNNTNLIENNIEDVIIKNSDKKSKIFIYDTNDLKILHFDIKLIDKKKDILYSKKIKKIVIKKNTPIL
jgi:hypothetical protein